MTDFVAYIDEAGDEGFKFLNGERGSSRWFVLAATVIRKANDGEVVKVARNVRELLGKPDKFVLHFRELKHEQRVPYVRQVAAMPIRTVSVLVHKPSIRNPENFQQEAHKLYRYCTRLLLERVSWLCRDHAISDTCSVDLIFSNRSAMSYDNLRAYLGLLQLQSQASSDISIHWPAIDCAKVRAVNHDKLAGLQLADAVASSVFYAVNKTQYGEVEDRDLQTLKATVYRRDGRADGYGLKFWCDAGEEKQRLIAMMSLD